MPSVYAICFYRWQVSQWPWTIRTISDTRKYDQGLSRLMHQDLHFLDIPGRVSYKLCLLTHRCLLGKAQVYLLDYCTPVSQVAARQHLRSAAHHRLVVPQHRLSTYGRQTFAVAGPMTFIALPDELRDPTVNTTTCRRLLKTHIFSRAIYTSSALEVKT